MLLQRKFGIELNKHALKMAIVIFSAIGNFECLNFIINSALDNETFAWK